MVRDYNPKDGMAFQGDVAIVPVPKGVEIDRSQEIMPIDGRLILQEGEVTGHHHAIKLPVFFRPEEQGRPEIGTVSQDKKLQKLVEIGTAKMFRDDKAARSMVDEGLMLRSDLCVGFLVVEGADVVLSHEEHDSISIPPGCYYIGRQVESAGAEERRVVD